MLILLLLHAAMPFYTLSPAPPLYAIDAALMLRAASSYYACRYASPLLLLYADFMPPP